jgi:L-amino acid N-acyltransferase YncA
MRRATKDDLDDILEIWVDGTSAATGGHHLKDDEIAGAREIFHQRLKTQDETFGVWVATTQEQRVIGWQSLQPFGVNPLRLQRVAGSSTYVRPKMGLGRVGLRLLLHAMDQAKKTQLEYLCAECLSSNRAVIRMAMSAGWERVGALPYLPRIPQLLLEMWAYPIPKAANGSMSCEAR